ncbi:hypothetical protein L7F22_053519 [Adiantum nelumboides]|nr:hypothetical protein [Adiantum nelumboides]
MASLEVYEPFTPPSTSPSSQTSSCDSSSSSSGDDSFAVVAPRARCTHPGRRLIHGRVYDSVLGVTCHWCRQKTVENHVFCCHCTISFCGGCLKNRHGEDIEVEMKDDVQWTCPRCRGGCGPGCDNCCNCGPCRKAQGMEPTGLLVHKARTHGFTNVHDYLIYQKTGECEEIIERRKRGKGWCQTDPLLFCKKQKRNETGSAVEASCRKRLNFSQNASQSEEKSFCKSLPMSPLQAKKVSFIANSKEHELSLSVQALKSKEDEKAPPSVTKDAVRKDEMLPYVEAMKNKEDEKASLSATKETVNLQLKPVQQKLVQNDLQSKAAPASVKGTLVQPKPEPEVFESVDEMTAPLPGEATNVHLFEHGVRVLQGVWPQQATPLSIPVESNSHESASKLKSAVRKEPLDLDLQLKNRNTNFQLKVKTEEVPLGHNSSACKSAFLEEQEDAHQPVNKRNESTFQISQVKTEICEQGLQHSVNPFANLLGDKAVNQPAENINGRVSQSMQVKAETSKKCSQAYCNGASPSANCQEDRTNTPYCTFSLDFVASSQSKEFLSCTSSTNSLIDEICRDRDMAGSSPSNFHLYPRNANFNMFSRTNFCLYPENSTSMPSIGKEVVDGQHLKPQGCKVKIESVSSQEAQDNINLSEGMAWTACMDASCSGHPKADNFVPLVAVKEEREDNWNAYCPTLPTKSTMQTNSLLGTFKVKTERQDVHFTIEPVLQCPDVFMDGRLQIKGETVVGTPASKLISTDSDDEAETFLAANTPKTSTGLDITRGNSFGDMSHLWKANDFSKKLEARLSEPFSRKEFEMLTAAASHRKPIYKARETRQGCSQFLSEEEGYSYLDHHPDLAQRLQECECSISRLSLLRGFFFWLEHASMLGAFKPWTAGLRLSDTQENDDCIEIDGPDCEIVAVVCSVD